MKPYDKLILHKWVSLNTMKLIRDISGVQHLDKGCVATIGNYDGLHLGHQAILGQLDAEAKKLNLPKVVISFEPLPSEFFTGDKAQRVYPFRDKARLLESHSIDYFLCLRFDNAMANMPPVDFVERILFQAMNVKALMVGDDFCFGKNRQGNFELLQNMGASHGMVVHKTETVHDDKGRISSTRIRQHLAAGKLSTASQLLGKRFCLSGRIRHGDKRGRTIGFPTANLRIQDNIAAINGVYAVKVSGLTAKRLDGVANLGTRPTVDGTETRLEVHLFDFDESVYGQHIIVELCEFIREEKRFENFAALTAQIHKDAISARELLQ